MPSVEADTLVDDFPELDFPEFEDAESFRFVAPGLHAADPLVPALFTKSTSCQNPNAKPKTSPMRLQ